MYRLLPSVLILVCLACGGTTGGGVGPGPWEARTYAVAPFDDNLTYNLSATVCERAPSAGGTLLLALHDLGYDRRQWTETPRGLSASAMSTLCALGYTVIAPDLLGAGQSARPDGDRLTLAVQAAAVQQLLAPLQKRYDRVALLGAGAGGAVAVLASTGLSRVSLALLGFSLHSYVFPILPVNFQPVLQQGPYVDFRVPAPGADSLWAFLGYYAPGADPSQPAFDDWTMGQTAPRGSWQALLRLQGGPEPLRPALVVHPVLEILGEKDPWFPAAAGAQDAALLPNAASFAVEEVKGTGHAIAQHLAAPAAMQKIAFFIK